MFVRSAVAGVTVSVVSVCWYLRPTRHSLTAGVGRPPVLGGVGAGGRGGGGNTASCVRVGGGGIDHIQTREVGNVHAALRVTDC